jgi:hypothetical protein
MAITSSVSQFLGKVNQGVRPNLFLASINFPGTAGTVGLPTGTDDKDLVNLLCKSAALPASNLGVIEVPFRGRTVKIAGDRTFDTWTATFINDRNMVIRNAMERWMRSMNAHEANTAELYTPNNSQGYTADITIAQLERDASVGGGVLRNYKLWGCFPTNVSQIDLAYDSNDQIEDFTVEFQLQYWTVESPTGGALSSGASSGVIS